MSKQLQMKLLRETLRDLLASVNADQCYWPVFELCCSQLTSRSEVDLLNADCCDAEGVTQFYSRHAQPLVVKYSHVVYTSAVCQFTAAT